MINSSKNKSQRKAPAKRVQDPHIHLTRQAHQIVTKVAKRTETSLKEVASAAIVKAFK